MKHIVDIFVVIFIIFVLLYALKRKTGEYIKIFITYFVPFIVVFFASSLVYLSLMKLPMYKNQIDHYFSSNTFLNGYMATEIILYLVLVLLIKIVFKIFTRHRLLVSTKELKKGLIFVNVGLAFVLGLMFGTLLVTGLGTLGLDAKQAYVRILDYNPLVDINHISDFKQKMMVYEVIARQEPILLMESLPEDVEKLDTMINDASLRYQSFYDQLTIESKQAIDDATATMEAPTNYQKANLVLTDTALYDSLVIFEAAQADAFLQSYDELKQYRDLISFQVNHGTDWMEFSKATLTSSKPELNDDIMALKAHFTEHVKSLVFYNSYLSKNYLPSDVATLFNEEVAPIFADKNRYLDLIRAYSDYLKNGDSKFLKLYIHETSNLSSLTSFKDCYLNTGILKPYQQMLLKNQILATYLSDKITGDEEFSQDMLRAIAFDLQIDLNSMTSEQKKGLDEQIQALNLTENASEQLKSLYN